MKLKKIIAGIAAAAVAVSMTAVNAFAAITNANDPDGQGFYVVAVDMSKYDATAVYGFSAKLSGDYIGETGAGGAMVFNSASDNWNQHEWGNEGSGKEVTTTEDGVLTLLLSSPAFTASDQWAQCVVQQYWGGDFAVDSITLLGKDGKPLAEKSAAPAETTAAVTEAADEDDAVAVDEDVDDVVDGDEAEASDDGVLAISEDEGNDAPAPAETAAVAAETTAAPAATTTTAPTTGNVPAAVMLSVMAAAGVAAVVSKKRK